jgi:hypothetical protein
VPCRLALEALAEPLEPLRESRIGPGRLLQQSAGTLDPLVRQRPNERVALYQVE